MGSSTAYVFWVAAEIALGEELAENDGVSRAANSASRQWTATDVPYITQHLYSSLALPFVYKGEAILQGGPSVKVVSEGTEHEEPWAAA